MAASANSWDHFLLTYALLCDNKPTFFLIFNIPIYISIHTITLLASLHHVPCTYMSYALSILYRLMHVITHIIFDLTNTQFTLPNWHFIFSVLPILARIILPLYINVLLYLLKKEGNFTRVSVGWTRIPWLIYNIMLSYISVHVNMNRNTVTCVYYPLSALNGTIHVKSYPKHSDSEHRHNQLYHLSFHFCY